jgi:2-(1,2-epoxy-1,2-dihydrophenyl)acetyl-CoA isomerase
MPDDPILVERDGGVATVTFNRPDRMNTFTNEMFQELPGRLRELAEDPEVRCVVLTGSGERAFSAGLDLASSSATASPDVAKEPMEVGIDHLKRFQDSSWLLHTMSKPTLAAVNGAAAGASLSMALACDLRIASENAIFRTAFAQIGFSGDFGGSYFLTKILGTARARELYFLADRVDAQEALRIGLVNRVVPKSRLRQETRALAERLAAGPPLAYRYMKRNLNLALTGHLRDVIDLEAEAMVRTGLTDDFREAARAFLQKRDPTFRGR